MTPSGFEQALLSTAGLSPFLGAETATMDRWPISAPLPLPQGWPAQALPHPDSNRVARRARPRGLRWFERLKTLSAWIARCF